MAVPAWTKSLEFAMENIFMQITNNVFLLQIPKKHSTIPGQIYRNQNYQNFFQVFLIAQPSVSKIKVVAFLVQIVFIQTKNPSLNSSGENLKFVLIFRFHVFDKVLLF